MITTIVLIRAEPKLIPKCAKHLAGIDGVTDVYSVSGKLAAKIRRNDNGTAFRVADHFKVCWRNQDEAEELYGQHRAALREDRGLVRTPPRDDAEGEIIERLAALAQMVDGNLPPHESPGSPAPAAPPAAPAKPEA
jgi:hypothetical protein